MDGVVKSRSKRRHSGLSHASRRSIALDDVNAGVFRSAVHANELIVVKVALVHYPIGDSDLAKEGETCAEVGSSLDLVADVVGRDDRPSIDRCPDIGDLHLTLFVYFDFHHRSHVSQEGAVCGDTEAMSFPTRTFSPA